MARILFFILALLSASCSQEAPKEDSGKPDNTKETGDTGPKESDTAKSAELRFEVPKEWKSAPPKTKLRKAQYTVPDKEGKSGDADFVVYYFGVSGGGSLDDNIARWKGAFTGGNADEEPQKFKAGKLDATIMDLWGTYSDQFTSETHKNHRMIVAAVETPRGNYYLKLIGPSDTVGDWRKEFEALLKSCRMEGGEK